MIFVAMLAIMLFTAWQRRRAERIAAVVVEPAAARLT